MGGCKFSPGYLVDSARNYTPLRYFACQLIFANFANNNVLN